MRVEAVFEELARALRLGFFVYQMDRPATQLGALMLRFRNFQPAKRSPIDFPSFADKLESIELGASHSESEPYDFPRQGAQIVFFFPVDQMFHIVAVD